MRLGKENTLNGKQGRPPNVLLIQRESIAELITKLAKPRLDSFPSFLYALDNKRVMYDHGISHDEEGVKANPFPCGPVDKKSERNAMSNKKLPGFITSDGMNNPFGI